MNPLTALGEILAGSVQPPALRTDAEARFPREAISALGEDDRHV